MTAYRLLAVEDNQGIADMICLVAKEAGFVTQSIAGTAMMAAYESFRPDVIVLDILMPDMDGIEVLQFLKDRGCRARIVILSGSEELSRRIAGTLGAAAGLAIDANIPKPFRVNEMRAVLEKIKTSLNVSSKREEIA